MSSTAHHIMFIDSSMYVELELNQHLSNEDYSWKVGRRLRGQIYLNQILGSDGHNEQKNLHD